MRSVRSDGQMALLESALRELVASMVQEEVRRAIRQGGLHGGDLLTVAEAARAARLSPATIRRKIREGTLPATGTGKLLRVRRGDLELLLTAGTTTREIHLSPEQQAVLDDLREQGR